MLLRDDGRRFVIGDSGEIRRTVTDLPAGDTVSEAWFTVKRRLTDAQDDAVVEKQITSSNVPGTGQIEDVGASQTAILRFDLHADDLLTLKAGRRYVYDIQIVMASGLELTLAEAEPDPRGVTFDPQVTVI